MSLAPDPKGRRNQALSRARLEDLIGPVGESSGKQRPRSALGRQLFEYVLEQPVAGGVQALAGRILIVDHDKLSREILARNLQREGYAVEMEESGPRALEQLGGGGFDLVLWDVHLPTLNGLDFLTHIRKEGRLQHLPVVLLSGQQDADSVIRCIEAGAEDYLAKPFNPALLKARIRGCMERKALRDQEQRLLATIQAQRERLREELDEASAYLQSLLPARFTEPFGVDWRFIPSSELGGDSFGYHWIDDDHFALYLLDVCGHGVGAALLSVAALNLLRSGAMHGVDFRDPSAVLGAANRTFPMEAQNNRYFTLWYGVYQKSQRRMVFGSGGHPAAILCEPGASTAKKLTARGMMIGGMPNSRYPTQSCDVPPGSRFFLFSDGAYEVTLPEGRVYTFDEFGRLLRDIPEGSAIDLDALVGQIRGLRGQEALEDDLSLIAIQF